MAVLEIKNIMSFVEAEGLAEELRLWPVDCWKGTTITLQLQIY